MNQQYNAPRGASQMGRSQQRRVVQVPPPLVEEAPPESYPPFEEGAVVKLRSGSPDMTVALIHQTPDGGWMMTTVWCCPDGKLQSVKVFSECLVAVPKPETPAPKG